MKHQGQSLYTKTERLIKSCRSQDSSDCSLCSDFHWPLMQDRCRWSFCLSMWSLDHRCPGECWQVHGGLGCYVSVHYDKGLFLLLRSGFTVAKWPGEFSYSIQHALSQGYDWKKNSVSSNISLLEHCWLSIAVKFLLSKCIIKGALW